MMTTLDIIQMFLKMKTPNTRRSYETAIRDLESHCGKITEISSRQAMEYFVELKNRELANGETTSSATLRHRFNVLSSVYNYLVDMGLMDKNPLRPVGRALSWRQQAQVRPTALLEFGAVRRLLRLPDSTKEGIRDRAILALFFGAGLRRSEALSLKIDDIKIFEAGKKSAMYAELIHTKGGKRQVRGIAKFAWKYLSVYVSQRKQDGAENADPLFVFYYQDGKVRGAMSEATLYRAFRGYCRQLGIKAAPHAARATFGTALHAKTNSDLLVSRALGHASTMQIGKYVKYREETQLREIIDLDYK